MCPLGLALYGHPLSGFFWEQHCHTALSKVGFEALEGWECVFVHKKLGLFLSVYVDDFKLAGRAKNLQAGWNLIRKHLRLDPPTPLGDYLGCGQKESTFPSASCKSASATSSHLYPTSSSTQRLRLPRWLPMLLLLHRTSLPTETRAVRKHSNAVRNHRGAVRKHRQRPARARTTPSILRMRGAVVRTLQPARPRPLAGG